MQTSVLRIAFSRPHTDEDEDQNQDMDVVLATTLGVSGTLEPVLAQEQGPRVSFHDFNVHHPYPAPPIDHYQATISSHNLSSNVRSFQEERPDPSPVAQQESDFYRKYSQIYKIWILRGPQEEVKSRFKVAQLLRECFLKEGCKFSIGELGLTEIPPGLRYLQNLRHLMLHSNKITDIRPLSRLTNLEALRLQGNKVEDISPLTALKGLRDLNIGGNPVKDINPIFHLTNLEVLKTPDGAIKDFSRLSEFKSLKYFLHGEETLSEVAEAEVAEGDPSSHFDEGVGIETSREIQSDVTASKLQSLALQFMDQASISAPESAHDRSSHDHERAIASTSQAIPPKPRIGHSQASMEAIQKRVYEAYAKAWKDWAIERPWAKTSDRNTVIERIKDCFLNHRDTLDLRGFQLTELPPYFKALKTLKFLDLSRNHFSDLTPLASLTQLEALDLSSNQLTDISCLSKLTRLKICNLFQNRLEDITPLKFLTQLERLNLCENCVKSFAPLASLPHLKSLDLAKNDLINVRDVECIKHLKSIFFCY